jgi:hypothetical protein
MAVACDAGRHDIMFCRQLLGRQMIIQIDTTRPLDILEQDILALLLDRSAEQPEPQTITDTTWASALADPETATYLTVQPEPEPEPEPEPVPKRRGRPAKKTETPTEQPPAKTPEELHSETRDLVTSLLREGKTDVVRAALGELGFARFSDVPVDQMPALRTALSA